MALNGDYIGDLPRISSPSELQGARFEIEIPDPSTAAGARSAYATIEDLAAYLGATGNAGGNQAPTVTISRSNTGNAVIGQQETFQATASDSDGTVVQVDLLQMSSATSTNVVTTLDTDLASPYVLYWTPQANGTVYLRTRATDNGGKQSLSSVLTIVVGVTTTKLATPTGLAVIAGPDSSGKYTLSWNGVANASGYRLLQGGSVQIGTGTATSYLVSPGSYQVQALGSGAYSNSDYSTPSVQVGNGATYNTTLSNANQISQGGMSFPTPGSATLNFNDRPTASGPTVSVVFQAAGVTTYVDYPSEFGGDPFVFTDDNGVAHRGTFPTSNTTLTY